MEIPPSFWGWVAVFVTLLNLLFLCSQLELPLLWLVTVASWVSTACLWEESVSGCSVFLWLVWNCWGPFPFSWLNKTSSLRFSLQVMGLQLQQPSCPLSVQFISATPVWGTQARHRTTGVASKVPDKGNNHLCWPPVYTLDGAVSCCYYTSLQGHSKFCCLQSKTEYTGINGLCR